MEESTRDEIVETKRSPGRSKGGRPALSSPAPGKEHRTNKKVKKSTKTPKK